ncbi:hypothetical protein DWZ70_02525 [Mediterraneibacter gnavus]|jgi:hypothetical protein|nr:hypothetical protein DWZ70_02525 [Mediterraneibacter gnavus]
MVVVVLLGGEMNMDFNQLGTVIFAIGTTMWIPIWALFEGVAKCIRALKGTDVTRSNKSHDEWSDSDDEDLEENEPKEANNATEQKTKRTRTTTKTAKDSSQK